MQDQSAKVCTYKCKNKVNNIAKDCECNCQYYTKIYQCFTIFDWTSVLPWVNVILRSSYCDYKINQEIE